MGTTRLREEQRATQHWTIPLGFHHFTWGARGSEHKWGPGLQGLEEREGESRGWKRRRPLVCKTYVCMRESVLLTLISPEPNLG